MALRLNALDIVRCRIPQAASLGDPTKPGSDFHRALVIRTTNEADGSQWAHVVFGTGQRTSDKGRDPLGDNELEVDPENGTGLTTQTRFNFKKHVALKVEEPWFPSNSNQLARGHLPKQLHAQVLSLIAKFAPVLNLTSSVYTPPAPPKTILVETKRKRLIPPGEGGTELGKRS